MILFLVLAVLYLFLVAAGWLCLLVDGVGEFELEKERSLTVREVLVDGPIFVLALIGHQLTKWARR